MFSKRSYIFALALGMLAFAGTEASAQCFNGGVLRMRSGPGQYHPIVGTIPAGAGGVAVGQCVAPDDGISQYNWCRVRWQGLSGWVSACGLR
jgi:uncharacterized protein YraI